MAESTIPTHTGDGASAPSDEHEATRSEERFVPPPVDICEDEQGLVVVADLPGVEPGAVDVRVERRVLTIQARAQQFASGHPLHREFELAGFYRQFVLPEEVDVPKISAALRDGVLILRLPRAEPAQPRRIEVRTQ
jgi:HSP20 family molecular chaperone IbpA